MSIFSPSSRSPGTARETVDRERTIELHASEVLWRAADGAPLALLAKSPPTPFRAAVILVHGLRGNRGNWNTSRRSFQNALVEAGYATVCLENRGSGASRAAGSGPPRTILELLELDLLPLIAEVATELGGPVMLVGHSLGGILACLAAAQAPNQVGGVVTLASPLEIGGDQPLIRLGTRIWLALSEAGIFDSWIESDAMGRGLMVARRLKDRLGLPPRVRSAWPESMEDAVRLEFDALNEPEPAFPGLLRDFSLMALGRSPRGFELERELRRVSVPVLCVAADRDELAPVSSTRALFDALGSERKSWLLAGADGSHFGHTDIILGQHAPEQVWRPLLDWLDSRLT